MSIVSTTTAQYLDTSTNTPVLNADWSYCLWLATALSGTCTALVMATPPGSDPFHRLFVTSAGTLRVESPVGGDLTTIGGGNVAANEWVWLGFLHDQAGGTTKIYRAGANLTVTLETTITETYSAAGNYLILYLEEDLASNRFKGPIVAYKEWNSLLTADQIANEARQMWPARTTNLRRFLPTLNNAEGGRDYSGNGFNLTKHSTFTDSRLMPPIPFSRHQPLRLR
jgi:hypothetical protein